MIYTVTFNPALDYVVHLNEFRLGGVNRTEGEEIQYGGKGINVSVVLRNLGIRSVALGFVAGFTGCALEEGLGAMGIVTDFIHLDDGFTRINVKIKHGKETEINGQGPVITQTALDALFLKLDLLGVGDVLDLSGSIPSTLPDDIYQKILERLDGRGIEFVVDATKDLLCESLPYKPFLIKPNNHELGEIFGEVPVSDAEIVDCAKRLQDRGARNVLVSMAGEGSLLVDETGGTHRLGVPSGQVVNSVGAGDSMVAGFLAGWLQSRDYAKAQRMGAAAGSATAFSSALGTREEIMALYGTF